MVLNGLDHLADAAPWLRGRRLGLITSTSGITRTLAPGIDAIHSQFPLTALFGPEHGVRGDHDAGATVETYTDPATGLQPVPRGLSAYDARNVGLGRYGHL